jgi:hypothetical protein
MLTATSAPLARDRSRKMHPRRLPHSSPKPARDAHISKDTDFSVQYLVNARRPLTWADVPMKIVLGVR